MCQRARLQDLSAIYRLLQVMRYFVLQYFSQSFKVEMKLENKFLSNPDYIDR
jgi:hypothetical protein